MTLKELLKTLTFENFIVLLDIPELDLLGKKTIYDFQNDDRSSLLSYLDYKVKSCDFMAHGYNSDKPCLLINIKGQKIA